MDPGIKVPPEGYGGIERIVALLAEEYIRLGHIVDILATEGSKIKGCTCYSIGKEGFPPKKSEMNKALISAWKFIWINRKKYDLVHNFGRLLYLLPILGNPVKKIMCYQREIPSKNIRKINKLSTKNLIFVGCSADLVNRAKVPGRWFSIHNAVNFDNYHLADKTFSDMPLLFLGRIERVKGLHIAIDVALQTNRKLIIAGNISRLPEEISYYESEIKSKIDGNLIKYVGEVNDKEKNELFANASVLLMPIEWDEPFGIVMIESMACGTPVVGFRKGAIPEVVTDGVTGYVVNSISEMKNAIDNCKNINRKNCRLHAESLYDIRKIAFQYLEILNK